MCRAIKTLHNFKPPATDDEIRASALQFVRKLSGFTRPSKANEPAFERATRAIERAQQASGKKQRRLQAKARSALARIAAVAAAADDSGTLGVPAGPLVQAADTLRAAL